MLFLYHAFLGSIFSKQFIFTISSLIFQQVSSLSLSVSPLSFFLLSCHLHVPSTTLHPQLSVHSPHPLLVHKEPHTYRPSPASGWPSLWVCLLQEPLPLHLHLSLPISSHTMKCWTLPSPLLPHPPCWAALPPSLLATSLLRSKRATSFPSPPQSLTCPPNPACHLNLI